MIHFPKICPACQSTARHAVIPSSPEVETYRCEDCGHEWSAPAPPQLTPVPKTPPPRDWFPWKKRT